MACACPCKVGLFLTPDLSHFPSPGPGIPRCATDQRRGHQELAAWKLQRYKKHMCLCGLLNCHLLSISSLRPAARGSAFAPPASLSPLRSGRDAGSWVGSREQLEKPAEPSGGIVPSHGLVGGDTPHTAGLPGMLPASRPGFPHSRAPVAAAGMLPSTRQRTGTPALTCTGQQLGYPEPHWGDMG